MAMVNQLSDGQIVIGSNAEDGCPSPEHPEVEHSTSRPSSSASSTSKRSSPLILPSRQYSKDDLMKFSKFPMSMSWPQCLDPAYNNSTGKWDPERWFLNHRSDRASSAEACVKEPSGKRKCSDPKERLAREEKDDIVLSPQRRSFGTGCHVQPQQSSLAGRRPPSPNDADSYRDNSRRIGSGRIMNRDRDPRDWDRDRDYGYGGARRDRFDQDDDPKDRRYSTGRYNQRDRRKTGHNRQEEEPEWFSSGPTSQSETIELVGFEEPSKESDSKKTKKSAKKMKQASVQRSSLKSDEGEKTEASVTQKKEVIQEEQNSVMEDKSIIETGAAQEPSKTKNAAFDLEELLKMDWMSGLPLNEAPMESESRFTQFFRKESPTPDHRPGSGNNSRRSSLHDELVANVLNSISEPQLVIPSPTHNYFAPISPALSHSSGYALPQTISSSASKDIMDMLQSANTNDQNTRPQPGKSKSVRELEADLKRMVLGNEKKPQEEKSAFDKLLQHMSDSSSTPSVQMSMGPLDKSKAVQEQDLLHDMIGRRSSPQPPPFHMFQEKEPLFKIHAGPPGMPPNQYGHVPNQEPPQNEMLAHLMQKHQHQQQHIQQQQQQQQHIQQQQFQQQQMQQQQMQHQQQQQQQQMQHQQKLAQSNPSNAFSMDMLSKLLGPPPQGPPSPASPNMQGQPPLSRGDQQLLSSIIQYQRQRELLSTLLKQHQHSVPPHQQSHLRCPSAKEVQPTLTLPSLGVSPRQSPIPPPEAMGPPVATGQGRIPSPLVFGQQPPALSHAPAPIHPGALAQAMAQSTSPNTLQVQNPVVLQRVPSPQELAVHTQSILQNALIKRKLEEQKENFRKRQEAQRTNSPVPITKNGPDPSPIKGLSPTIAFTPISVMRKVQLEKSEIKEQKTMQQNGNKIVGMIPMNEVRNDANHKIKMNPSTMSSAGISASDFNNHFAMTQQNSGATMNQVPRALHGQGTGGNTHAGRSILGAMNSMGPAHSPGRPIVKIGTGQSHMPGNDLQRGNIMTSKTSSMNANKQFSNQVHNIHHEASDYLEKLNWQRQNAVATAAIPQLQMAATYAALNQRPPPINAGMQMQPAFNLAVPANAATNVNFPLTRNAVQNPVRAAQNNPLNQLGLNLAALQLQQQQQQQQQRSAGTGSLDSRQLQALAQSQRLHPAALQHILQGQVAAAAQVGVGFGAGGRNDQMSKQHLMPGQQQNSRQSPVNLTKWFGNEVLKQKMPDMPPVPVQKALRVDELERQQQTVHN